MGETVARHPFEYVTRTAEKYGLSEARVKNECEALIDRLTQYDLDQLSAIYCEIERREDVYALSQWMDEKADDGLAQSRHQVKMLFALFYGLAAKGIQPFSSRRVEWTRVDKPLDWRIIPEELRYLAEPARRYGQFQFSDQIDEFLDAMTPQQLAELQEVRKRVNRDLEKINCFLGKVSLSEHREAALVYFLIALLDYVQNE